jgi:hypothetical protein
VYCHGANKGFYEMKLRRIKGVSLILMLVLLLFQMGKSHAGVFDTMQDAVNKPLIPKKVVPYNVDDAKLNAMKPDYYGPEEASEASKLYVKHAKEMALSMSYANIKAVGWKELRDVCTSAGFFKNKMGGKYNGWPMDAEGATSSACSMFVSNNITKVMTFGGPGEMFRVQEDGRLLPFFYYKGNAIGSSKSKASVCSHVQLAARTSKRMTAKEFGNNPEVIPASEALAMTWDATLKSWECGGVGGYMGW